jgi:hypothetical protein
VRILPRNWATQIGDDSRIVHDGRAGRSLHRLAAGDNLRLVFRQLPPALKNAVAVDRPEFRQPRQPAVLCATISVEPGVAKQIKHDAVPTRTPRGGSAIRREVMHSNVEC